jgi:hypothetical protein
MSNHIADAALHPAAQGATYLTGFFAWLGLSPGDIGILAGLVTILLGTTQTILALERRFRGGGKRRKGDKQEHEQG